MSLSSGTACTLERSQGLVWCSHCTAMHTAVACRRQHHYIAPCLLLLLQVFLWDVASGGVIRKFRGHDSRINAVSATCMVGGMAAKQCTVLLCCLYSSMQRCRFTTFHAAHMVVGHSVKHIHMPSGAPLISAGDSYADV
jgi:hypothetical protein